MTAAFEVPADPSSRLRCRLFEERDLPGILRLWESESGWGGLTAELWKSWYRDTPHGDAIVTVTVDERDDVVGQMVFTPAVVRVNQQKFASYRMSAPILASSLRTIGVWKATHPFAWMYFTGVNEAVARGGQLLYAFPVHKWLGVWNRWKSEGVIPGRTVDRECGCLSLPVPVSVDPVESGGRLMVARIAEPAGEHARLWDEACFTRGAFCAIDRSVEWLRYNRGEGISLEARDADGRLAGYAVIRRDGLLSDLIVLDQGRTGEVLEAIVGFLSRAPGPPGQRLAALSLMDTSEIGPFARSLGATEVDFRFAFICSLLSASVPDVALLPESWQLMPGD